jgi:NADH-quinone oxidoreductase subunit N
MTFADLQTLLPLLVLSTAGVVVMLAIAARRHHGAALALTLAGLAATVASAAGDWPTGSLRGASR